jgi:hypothetical protein
MTRSLFGNEKWMMKCETDLIFARLARTFYPDFPISVYLEPTESETFLLQSNEVYQIDWYCIFQFYVFF